MHEDDERPKYAMVVYSPDGKPLNLPPDTKKIVDMASKSLLRQKARAEMVDIIPVMSRIARGEAAAMRPLINQNFDPTKPPSDTNPPFLGFVPIFPTVADQVRAGKVMGDWAGVAPKPTEDFDDDGGVDESAEEQQATLRDIARQLDQFVPSNQGINRTSSRMAPQGASRTDSTDD